MKKHRRIQQNVLEKLEPYGVTPARYAALTKMIAAGKLTTSQENSAQIITYPHGSGTVEKVRKKYDGLCARIGFTSTGFSTPQELWLVWKKA